MSATKFIDFFVHDILDYTLLNKEEGNFSKNITVFDIQDAVTEIVQTLDDKCSMKNIKIETNYKEFNNQVGDKLLVKTD